MLQKQFDEETKETGKGIKRPHDETVSAVQPKPKKVKTQHKKASDDEWDITIGHKDKLKSKGEGQVDSDEEWKPNADADDDIDKFIKPNDSDNESFDLADKPDTDFLDEPADLPPCQFGKKCYRKNPDHFKQYSHPK